MRCPKCDHANSDVARFCELCAAVLDDSGSDPTAMPLPASVGGGRYRVLRVLGEGARKLVYAAVDERLGREVAAAVIKTEGLDEAGRTRIDREARAMARLGDHPNIVTVFDVGDDVGHPYIVSQLMVGGSVADTLEKTDGHRIAVDDALRIAEQVALALAHAHERGVVHRDLKAANVWLAADGAALLGDFGLAVETDRSRLTSEGMVVGTVAYLAPEQAVGRAPDARSDLYALGAFLYEMLCGRPPFLGDDAVSVISQHLNTVPVAPSWHNAAVPPVVEAFVMGLLAKDPAARPQPAATVATELRRLRAEHPVAVAETASGPTEVVRAGAFGRFVGRAGELESLEAVFDEMLGGRSRLVMVVGEPGIGKTRLVEELGVYASVRGAQVCWGHCYEGELGAPYLPFVEALRAYVRDRSDDELRVELSTGAPEVATIVSDLRARFPDLPVAPALDGDAERMRLFEGVSSFLASASAARPFVLVLDDVHWADKPTLLLLQYLARNLRRERIMILCTYRDVELDRTHPLAEAVATLRREHLYERVLLRGFDRNEVKAFIEAVGEQETPEIFAETIYRETEGNPFFVAEILRHLGETGALQRVDGQWVGTADSVAEHLPEGVREVIGRRLSQLGDDCNRMLTIGAAMPGGFSLDVVGRVLDADDDHVLDLLDEALGAQIVRERRDQSSVYEFNHALIRQTLYAELSTPRRVRLHRQILGALEGQYSANPEARLAELAYHAFQAAPGGDIDKAVDYATRAGRRASASAAHEEAARSYDLAMQALDLYDAPDEHQRAELLLLLGEAQNRAGTTEAARATFAEAAELARRLDAPVLLGRIAYDSGRLAWPGTRQPELLALLEEAVEGLGDADDTLRAFLLARCAGLVHLFDVDRSRRLAEEAVEAARRSGDPGALAIALYHFSYHERDRDQHLDLVKEVRRYAEQAGDLELVLISTDALYIRALTDGDRAALDHHLDEFARIAAETRSPSLLAAAAQRRAEVAIIEGDFEAGERLALEVLEQGRRLGDRAAVDNFGVIIFPIFREWDRLGEFEHATRAVIERAPEVVAWRVALAQILVQSGKLDEAQAELDVLAKDDFTDIPNDVAQNYAVAGAAEVAATLGDRDRAASLYARLLSRSGLGISLGPTAYHGAADRYLGLLASVLDRPDDAIMHHEAALTIHDRMRARPWRARSEYDLARALLARDRPGDRERALGLLNDALDTANTLGMTGLVQEVLTEKLGVQGVSPSSSIMASIDVVAASVALDRPDLRDRAGSDGSVTVLFTDIEGYTTLNERLGDSRTQSLLRVHDALVRDAVTRHRGTVVKSAGDGFMLVFGDSAAGLACAIALQRMISSHDFGEDAGPVRIRIGAHAGAVIREGDDFYGRTVILAARIAAQARGGEIAVSDALRNSVSDHALDLDGHWGSMHDVALKGFTDAHRVHALEW